MKTSRRRSFGGVFLLAVLMGVTVILAVIGALEERAVETPTIGMTETRPQLTNTTLPTEITTAPEVGNTSTTTIRI